MKSKLFFPNELSLILGLLALTTTACTGGFSAKSVAAAASVSPSTSSQGNGSSGSSNPSPTQAPSPAPSPSPIVGGTIADPAAIAGQGYILTFDDEFTSNTVSSGPGPLVSGMNWYNGTEQCCMSPTNASVGVMFPLTYNTWANPQTSAAWGSQVINPYSLIPGGGLNISLTMQNGYWNSGVMQTLAVDPITKLTAGFSQQYGYFEMSAALPPGAGTWPGFWMLPVSSDSSARGEIDIIEQYGQFNANYCITLHDWNANGNGAQDCQAGNPGTILSDGNYHTFGMLWTAATMTFYLDGVQQWQTPTLSVMNSPYYLLVDLGIGGGWPTENTPSPSVMKVKYVRAYKAP